jgi:hypothetical protein
MTEIMNYFVTPTKLMIDSLLAERTEDSQTNVHESGGML